MAGTEWLRDSVIYQIFMPSFADGDGDGIGDLKGAIAHLDHLEWLGVDAIWFNPCFDSPFRDAGCDVADYRTIAPRYGTTEDMAVFIAEARRRGIRVLLDLVAGHPRSLTTRPARSLRVLAVPGGFLCRERRASDDGRGDDHEGFFPDEGF
jgi:1,4-alpha-glucan branching enzyme